MFIEQTECFAGAHFEVNIQLSCQNLCCGE